MPGGFINGGFNIGRTMFPVPFGSRFSPAARDYFARLDAAGLRVSIYDDANAALIDRLVGNGGNFWPDSGAFCAMAGYLYPGNGAALIPLKDGHDAGTLNAFVTGDWNAVTGLKGDGSTKYVNSNRNNNADGQDDFSMGVYIETIASPGTSPGYMGAGNSLLGRSTNAGFIYHSCRSIVGVGTPAPHTGYFGVTRNLGASYFLRHNTEELTRTIASTEPTDANIRVFEAINKSDPRLPFYHIGPNLNGTGELAELDTILTEWKNALASA